MRILLFMSFIIGGLLGAVKACSNLESTKESQTVAKPLEKELIRYKDKELNVVCYRVKGYEGVSCLLHGAVQ